MGVNQDKLETDLDELNELINQIVDDFGTKAVINFLKEKIEDLSLTDEDY